MQVSGELGLSQAPGLHQVPQGLGVGRRPRRMLLGLVALDLVAEQVEVLALEGVRSWRAISSSMIPMASRNSASEWSRRSGNRWMSLK
jgi:hypothetical protein